MSFYSVPDSAYRHTPAGSPGWQRAPVPGWGVNPAKAGSPIVGAGASPDGLGQQVSTLPHYTQLFGDAGDQYKQFSVGHLGFAAAGGILVGAILTYAALSSGYLKG